MTRGLAEISRVGSSWAQDPLTFIGLSGVGDLIVTCAVHSRNWRAGNALGQGEKLPDVLENMGMVVEGVSTTKVATTWQVSWVSICRSPMRLSGFV